MNGAQKGDFQCKSRVRQDGHLSFYFFCLGEDYLSRLLAVLVRQGKLTPMHSNGYSSLSHFLYANDILVFGWAFKHDLKVIVEAFHDYGMILGQMVSWEKSYVFWVRWLG